MFVVKVPRGDATVQRMVVSLGTSMSSLKHPDETSKMFVPDSECAGTTSKVVKVSIPCLSVWLLLVGVDNMDGTLLYLEVNISWLLS